MKLVFFLLSRHMRGHGSALLSINARMSFLGVFTGCTLLVIVLSIFNGFQKQLRESIFSFDPHIQLSNEFGSSGSPMKDWQGWVKSIHESIPELGFSLEGMIQSPALLRYQRRLEQVFIRSFQTGNNGLPSYFPELVKKLPGDLPRKPVYIGQEMALLHAIPLGATIELVVARGEFQLRAGVTPSVQKFKVAGFFKTGHYHYDSKIILLPLNSMQSLFDIGNQVQTLALRLNDPSRLRDLRYKLQEVWPFSIRTIEDEQRNFFAALQLEKTIMTTIVFLFILAAMVGIIVASFSSIRSRRRDIGILKALGLSKKNILLLFTLNGFIMGTLGTILGLMTGIYLAENLEAIITFIEQGVNTFGLWYNTQVLGKIWINVQLIPRDVYYFDQLPVHIDLAFLNQLAVLAIFLSGLSSFIPAWQASKLEPIDIIRRAEQ